MVSIHCSGVVFSSSFHCSSVLSFVVSVIPLELMVRHSFMIVCSVLRCFLCHGGLLHVLMTATSSLWPLYSLVTMVAFINLGTDLLEVALSQLLCIPFELISVCVLNFGVLSLSLLARSAEYQLGLSKDHGSIPISPVGQTQSLWLNSDTLSSGVHSILFRRHY